MALDEKQTTFVLEERDIPTHWYNIVPDLPSPPAPALHPGTGQPLGPADLAPLFPMGIILQEVSQEPMIEIPDEVRDIYRLWRSSRLPHTLLSVSGMRLPDALCDMISASSWAAKQDEVDSARTLDDLQPASYSGSAVPR